MADPDTLKSVETTAGESVSQNSASEGPKWTTSRIELWAFYLYYVGNNGLSGFNCES